MCVDMFLLPDKNILDMDFDFVSLHYVHGKLLRPCLHGQLSYQHFSLAGF